MEGVRFERRAEGGYYKVILHVGSFFIPVSDDIVEDLKTKSALLGDRFLDFFLEKVGYSSYLKDRIKQELAKIGDKPKQISSIRESILNL